MCFTCWSFTCSSSWEQQGSRSKSKLTAENPSRLTWVRATSEGSDPLQCPLSTLRETITDKLKPNPSGAGKTDPHPQVSSTASSLSPKTTWMHLITKTFCLSLSRIHAVPLQPTDHAHIKQHTTHLHSFPFHTEPAAATTCSWSPCGPAACVAASAVRAIRDPFW